MYVCVASWKTGSSASAHLQSQGSTKQNKAYTPKKFFWLIIFAKMQKAIPIQSNEASTV